jgi:hypothetical protein
MKRSLTRAKIGITIRFSSCFLLEKKSEEKAWRERTWGKSEKKNVRESLKNLRFERKAGEKRSGGKCEKKHEKRRGEKQEKEEKIQLSGNNLFT